MVSKAYIPSLIAIGDVVPNGTKMVPNLVWLIFSLFSTTFSCNIFRLDQHRKILFSKSADFVIFSDITNKMADVSDILYISTALLVPKPTTHPFNKNSIFQSCLRSFFCYIEQRFAYYAYLLHFQFLLFS